MRSDEKEREKNLVPNSFLDDPDKKIPKKIAKKFKKIKKHHSIIFFYPNGEEIGRERKKKIYRISFLHNPRKKTQRKNSKILKKLKNLIPTLFLFKPG